MSERLDWVVDATGTVEAVEDWDRAEVNEKMVADVRILVGSGFS